MKQLTPRFLCFVCLLLTSFAPACNKKGEDNNPSPDSSFKLKGTIYYIFAGKFYQHSLSAGERSEIAKNPSYETLGLFEEATFDVSRDGSEMLVLTDPPAKEYDFDHVYFNLMKTGDATKALSRFKVGTGLGTLGYAKLSPDKNRIAAAWPYRDNSGKIRTGIFIWDRTGKRIATYTLDDKGNEFKEMSWLPDGNLILTTQYAFFKTNDTSLLRASVITEPKLSSFGQIAASPDGKRIAFRSSKHIWTINVDGSGLTQVTDSNDNEESAPQWSPDNNYLLFLAPQFAYATSGIPGFSSGNGSIPQIVVIPADGKKYDLKKEYWSANGGTQGGETLVATNGAILVLFKDSNYKNPVGAFARGDVAWR